MQILKGIFYFYIHSSIHVALAVVSFLFFRMNELQLQINLEFLLFIFLATITGYNFVKFAGVARLHHRSLTNQLKSIQIFSMLVFLGMVYLAFQLRWETNLILLGLSFINFLYAFPIFSNGRNLRSFGGVKVFVIALVWSSTVVLLPVFEMGIQLSKLIYFQFIQQLLFVLALMIPFEIRDFCFDEDSLQTLPQILGVWKTKLLGILLLIFSLLIAIYIEEIDLIFTIIFSMLLGVSIMFSKKNQLRYYAAFWVEAIPLFALIMYLFIYSSFAPLF